MNTTFKIVFWREDKPRRKRTVIRGRTLAEALNCADKARNGNECSAVFNETTCEIVREFPVYRFDIQKDKR